VSYDSGIAALSIAIGQDARTFDADGPLPEIPRPTRARAAAKRVVALAKRENLTVRQIAGRLGGYGGLAVMGTPRMIADQMEEWAGDGSQRRLQRHVPLSAGRARRFRQQGRPELQRRGIFRTEYEGATLRENLGLPRPRTASSRPRPRLRSKRLPSTSDAR